MSWFQFKLQQEVSVVKFKKKDKQHDKTEDGLHRLNSLKIKMKIKLKKIKICWFTTNDSFRFTLMIHGAEVDLDSSFREKVLLSLMFLARDGNNRSEQDHEQPTSLMMLRIKYDFSS